MLWSIYILGNFLAVGVMSLFHLAPTGRRCWGFFQENSYDYKRFVGLGALERPAFSMGI